MLERDETLRAIEGLLDPALLASLRGDGDEDDDVLLLGEEGEGGGSSNSRRTEGRTRPLPKAEEEVTAAAPPNGEILPSIAMLLWLWL